METGERFQRETTIVRLGPSDQKLGLDQPPLEVRLAGGDELELPAAQEAALGAFSLRDAISGRRSLRTYSDQPLSLADLSYLLWATQGITRTWEGREPARKEGVEPRVHRVTFRNVPSAGARHAFETIVVAGRISGLAPGAYQYLPLDGKLLALDLPGVRPAALAAACLGQEMIERAAATFVWVAVRERMTWRYGERGYRYLYLDAGHVGQNLSLACEAIGAGACMIGAYDDDAVNALFGLDGVDRFAIYLASTGKKPAASG
ncbi:MAG: SagB/ThcOx family dehydrogenase [Candidatus Bipolaricaulota bacterium]